MAGRDVLIDVDVRGHNSKHTLDALRAGIRTIVRRETLDTQAAIKNDMRQPKHGRLYYRGRGRWHQASEAGESPAVDSGKLINSLVTDFTDSGMTGSVSSDVPYAAYLEEGTRNMEPRPYINPEADRTIIRFYLAMDALLDLIFGAEA